MFVRKRLAESSRDRYDLNLKSLDKTNISTTEYWTNGTTTLLTAASVKPMQKPNLMEPPASILTRPTKNDQRFNYISSGTKRNPQKSVDASNRNVVRDSLIAGSFGGMASIVVCHPFDVLRVKMQSSALASAGNMGVVGTFRHTVQQGGFRALYAGLALPLAAQALYKGTIFTVNNVTEKAIIDWKTLENHKLGNFAPYKLTLMDRFFSGCMGGAVVAALFVTPVEFVRNQLIVETSPPKTGMSGSAQLSVPRGPLDVIRRTMRSEGITGLWRGVTSTILRDSIGCGFFFVAMNYTQRLLAGDDEAPPSRPAVVASGALAGMSFWVVGLPLDTMKTWIQNGSAKNLSHALELSQRDGFRQGIVALNRGWQVAYGRGAPSAAISVTVYSTVYNLLGPVS